MAPETAGGVFFTVPSCQGACGSQNQLAAPIPSYLGVQCLQNAALARYGKRCKRVATRVTRIKGGFTVAPPRKRAAAL